MEWLVRETERVLQKMNQTLVKFQSVTRRKLRLLFYQFCNLRSNLTISERKEKKKET